MSVGCGWTTRTARVQPYGWVGNSGYDLGVFARLWRLPFEIELGRRLFDDYQYGGVDRFSMDRVGASACTIVVTYDGKEEWRVR